MKKEYKDKLQAIEDSINKNIDHRLWNLGRVTKRNFRYLDDSTVKHNSSMQAQVHSFVCSKGIPIKFNNQASSMVNDGRDSSPIPCDSKNIPANKKCKTKLHQQKVTQESYIPSNIKTKKHKKSKEKPANPEEYDPSNPLIIKEPYEHFKNNEGHNIHSF